MEGQWGSEYHWMPIWYFGPILHHVPEVILQGGKWGGKSHQWSTAAYSRQHWKTLVLLQLSCIVGPRALGFWEACA